MNEEYGQAYIVAVEFSERKVKMEILDLVVEYMMEGVDGTEEHILRILHHLQGASEFSNGW